MSFNLLEERKEKLQELRDQLEEFEALIEKFEYNIEVLGDTDEELAKVAARNIIEDIKKRCDYCLKEVVPSGER